ncbi:MAG TPA: reverse transcriptase domain-containing protein [Microvirga sp.]|jgi:retron-type reverse transcriptase|nr:reverse transcriptase domain-containing protein [Microvirga sp.]
MPDLKQAFTQENLGRAYRWIRSSTDARYKSFFRDTLEAYALTSAVNLEQLREDLLFGRWQPSPASKVFVPKPSGLLRTYTILTLEDQLVYQALVNLIAEALQTPKVRKRRFSSVFNHLYAGKSSRFFHVRWQTAHRKYKNRIKSEIADGRRWVADFDLTAFYDSIDHQVIAHFLRRMRFDNDFINFLISCLSTWTCTTWPVGRQRISHGHGIPQGPLASGMLSEVVLQYFDERAGRGPRGKVAYLRYVDDIRVLANDEVTLRRRLVALDLTAKEVGLFPQSAKTRIRRVERPEDEVKELNKYVPPSQTGLIDLGAELIVLLKLRNPTDADDLNIRYLLHRTKPSAKINKYIVGLLRSRPHYSSSIRTYLSRYRKLPGKLDLEIRRYISDESHIYQTVVADLLEGIVQRVQPSVEVNGFVTKALRTNKVGGVPLQPNLKLALIKYGLQHGITNYSEIRKIIEKERDWWLVKEVISTLDIRRLGHPTFSELVNIALRNHNSEVCTVSIGALFTQNVVVTDQSLLSRDVIRRLATAKIEGFSSSGHSAIPYVLEYSLRLRRGSFDWVSFLGTEHQSLAHLALSMKQSFETDIDAYVVRLDAFCDGVLQRFNKLFDVQIGKSTFGSLVNSPPKRLKVLLPTAIDGFKLLHQLRGKSHTPHPYSLKTGQATRRIKHTEFWHIRKRLMLSLDELQRVTAPILKLSAVAEQKAA